jgi:hypothetical protein
MKVICIDNSGYESELTINKEYSAYGNFLFKLEHYSIENDTGDRRTYEKRRFVPLFKFRQGRINDLLN